MDEKFQMVEWFDQSQEDRKLKEFLEERAVEKATGSVSEDRQFAEHLRKGRIL